ncbi:hypothetical protein GLOTRDRAFT_134419, partial [Gloeophyllum trabeum ATCC 11539]
FFGHTVGHTALPYDRQDEFNAVESALPPQSTPVKKGGNPEGNSELKVEDTKIMADEELRGYCAPNISGLLELIFPDIALPCPLDALYRHVSKRGGKYKVGKKKKGWDKCPDLTLESVNGNQEAKMANFLTYLADDIRTFLQTTYNRVIPPRAVTGEFAGSTSVPGGPSNTGRHPDILFFEKDVEMTWENVVGCWELKKNNSAALTSDAKRQLAERALMIFESQDDRRFVPGVSVLGFRIILHIIDRAGEISSASFHMLDDPHSFLRLVVGFMFAGRDSLGFDPSIKKLDDGSRCITINNKTYTIHERVHTPHNIRGRGTNVWRATCDGTVYAIKDCWTDETRTLTEAKLLEMAKGVEGVLTLVAHNTVKYNKEDDTTGLVRALLKKPEYRERWARLDVRIHRRLVLAPFAVPIYYFRTKKELIGGFIDAIQAHKDLLEKAKVLHRDISIKNIMLVADIEGDLSRRRGLLIDLDYAVEYPELGSRKPAQAARTGTAPFMAIELLNEGWNVPHKPEWDLESFLYVIIWICILYVGPCDRRSSKKIKETPLNAWMTGGYKLMWADKVGCMESKSRWCKLLEEFAPYFEELKQCLSEWRALFFVDEGPRTHDNVLKILRDAYNRLPDEEPPFVDLVPVVANPPAAPSTRASVRPKRTRETERQDFSGVNQREDVVHGGKRLRKDRLENAYYSEQLFPSGGESSQQASLGSFAPTDAEEGSPSSASASVEPPQPLRRTRRKSMPSLKVRESGRP